MVEFLSGSTDPRKSLRLRRSILYMPGANARALEKAKNLDADGVIFDLEDAVAPDAKESARARVTAAVKSGGYGERERIVRMNSLDSPWGADDLTAIAASGAEAVLVPKVESIAMVRRIESALESAGAPPSLVIWCMVETPLGVLNAADIAAATPRLSVLVMGTSDLSNELRAAPSAGRAPLLAALSHCLLAARAHDKIILDGVHLDLEDADGFEDACRQGRAFGFDGKTLIHPKQIAPCNRIFSPSEDDVAQSRKIISAYRDATAAGKGVVLVDGRLVENLHVENAARILAAADAISAREGTVDSAAK